MYSGFPARIAASWLNSPPWQVAWAGSKQPTININCSIKGTLMSMADEFAREQAEQQAREQAEREERERNMALNQERADSGKPQPAYDKNQAVHTMDRGVLDRTQQAAFAQEIEKSAPEMDGGEREQAAADMQRQMREQQEREHHEPER